MKCIGSSLINNPEFAGGISVSVTDRALLYSVISPARLFVESIIMECTGNNSDIKSAIDKYSAYSAGVRGFSPHTVDGYRRDLYGFLEYCLGCGVNSISDINRDAVYGFLQKLSARKLSNATRQRALVAVKMFCRFVAQEGHLTNELSGVSQIPSIKREKKIPTILSIEQVRRLIESPGPKDSYQVRDRAILELLYATGMRCAELAGLKIKDLHFDQGHLKVNGKGNKERIIPVSKIAIQTVSRYMQVRRYEERELLPADYSGKDYVFVSFRRGNKLDRHDVWRLVKKYAGREGLPTETTVHTLRHSFPTHLCSRGADLRTIQMLLGHSSIATTEIYVNLDQQRIRQVYDMCHPDGR